MWFKHIVMAFTLMTLVSAAGAHTLRFQGRLTNAKGEPIIGTPQIRVQLFTESEGGRLAWETSSLQTVNTNSHGLFSTKIGPLPIDLFKVNPELFIQINVRGISGEQALKPRQPFSYAPFAFEALHAKETDLATQTKPNAVHSHHIQDGQVTSLDIEEGAITANHINPETIQAIHIASGAINSSLIENETIQASDLSIGSIMSHHVLDQSLTAIDLATDSISTHHLQEGSVTTEKIFLESITSELIEPRAIDSNHLSSNSISTDHLLDGAVSHEKIQPASVDNDQIQLGTITADRVVAQSFIEAGLGIPRGAIFIFLDRCPVGYSEVEELRGKFPVGTDTSNQLPDIPQAPNQSFGTAGHSHANVVSRLTLGGEVEAFDASHHNWAPFQGGHAVLATKVKGSPVSGVGVKGRPINNIEGTINTQPHYPPSLTVLFCEKD